MVTSDELLLDSIGIVSLHLRGWPRITVAVLSLTLLAGCTLQPRTIPNPWATIPMSDPTTSPTHQPDPTPSQADPSTRIDEIEFTETFGAFQLELIIWLGLEGIDTTAYPDPLPGEWAVTNNDELLTFNDGVMMWYRDEADPETYYRATYEILPGAKKNFEFVVEDGGNVAYSVFLDYDYTMTEGVGERTIFSGLFTVVTQPDGSLFMFNHRTNGEWVATRV